jgi:hypothetical protein
MSRTIIHVPVPKRRDIRGGMQHQRQVMKDRRNKRAKDARRKRETFEV